MKDDMKAMIASVKAINETPDKKPSSIQKKKEGQ